MDYDEEIKRYYSEWWENPRDIRNVIFDSLNEYVRQRIPQSNGGKALDLGSGHGRIISYLAEKGWEVTAVDFNDEFITELKGKFPSIRVISGDVRNVSFDDKFEVLTCLELVQNLNRTELLALLTKLAPVTKLLLVNMSNKNSFHAWALELRGWKANFVFNYTATEFEQILQQAGFHITHRRGIGLITPVSLCKDFKGKLIPIWFAKAVNKLDALFPKLCHLYYVEAVSQKV